MWSYGFQIAIANFKKNIGNVVAAAIAVSIGISVFIINLAIYHHKTSLPIASEKENSVWAVKLDTLAKNEWPHDGHMKNLSYRDVTALMRSSIPSLHVAGYTGSGFVSSEAASKRHQEEIRFTTSDVFSMFDTPFLYGAPWSGSNDTKGRAVAVISQQMNDKIFGGKNSVGERILVNNKVLEVVGVLGDWKITPKLYNLHVGTFDPVEAVFIPFSLLENFGIYPIGNTYIARLSSDDSTSPLISLTKSESSWIQYLIKLDDEHSLQKYRQFIANYIAQEKELGRFVDGHESDMVKLADWIKFNGVTGEENLLLVILSILFMLVCIVNVAGLLLAKTLGRLKEFAIYRAIGFSRMMLVKLQAFEILILSLISLVFASLLVALGLSSVGAYITSHGEVAKMDLFLVSVVLFSTFCVCAIAYLAPVIVASRIFPAKYLKND